MARKARGKSDLSLRSARRTYFRFCPWFLRAETSDYRTLSTKEHWITILVSDRRFGVTYVRSSNEFFLLQIPIDWFTCCGFSWYRRIMVAKKRGKRFLHGGWTCSWALGLPRQILQGNTINRSQMFQKRNRIWQVKRGFSFISRHNFSDTVLRSCKTFIEYQYFHVGPCPGKLYRRRWSRVRMRPTGNISNPAKFADDRCICVLWIAFKYFFRAGR